MSNINKNDLSNALCDIQDIKKMSELIWVSDGLGGRCQYKDLPKDNDGSEITIGDCIDDVINFFTTIRE